MEHLPAVIQQFGRTALSRANQDPAFGSTSSSGACLDPQTDLVPLAKVLEQAERQALESALRVFGHSVRGKRQAARALGISLATLYARLKRLGL